MAETGTQLYRAVQNSAFEAFTLGEYPGDGVLYPRFVSSPYTDRNGQTRTSRRDVKYDHDGNVIPGGGTSMHDCEGWFGFANWRYFWIPLGTEIPASLKITGGGEATTNASGRVTGRHYQIEPLAPMTVSALKGALDNLVRNGIVKQVKKADTKEKAEEKS